MGDDWTATLRPLVDAGDAGAGVDTDANLAVMKVPGGIRRLADLHPPLFLGVSDFSGVAAAATPLEIGRGMRDIRGAPIGLLTVGVGRRRCRGDAVAALRPFKAVGVLTSLDTGMPQRLGDMRKVLGRGSSVDSISLVPIHLTFKLIETDK